MIASEGIHTRFWCVPFKVEPTHPQAPFRVRSARNNATKSHCYTKETNAQARTKKPTSDVCNDTCLFYNIPSGIVALHLRHETLILAQLLLLMMLSIVSGTWGQGRMRIASSRCRVRRWWWWLGRWEWGRVGRWRWWQWRRAICPGAVIRRITCRRRTIPVRLLRWGTIRRRLR